MTYKVVKDFPHEIIYKKGETCISIYQPTHRNSPDNAADIIVYKNLLRKFEDALGAKYKEQEPLKILESLYEIRDDKKFWINTLDGLAVLATKDECIVYLLESPVETLGVISEKFHIKPLIRYFQSDSKYQLLGIRRNNFSLFEGTKYGLREIEIPADIPRTIEDVLGEEFTEDAVVGRAMTGSASGVAAYHGRGGKKDEMGKDIEKYFRYIDKTVLENFSKVSKLPLILVSLDEYQTEFKRISNNPYLLAEGIKSPVEALGLNQLRDRAWEIMDKVNIGKVERLKATFNNGMSTLMSTDDLKLIGKGAADGRIKTIMVETGRIINGTFDEATGAIDLEGAQADSEDLLESIVSKVLSDRGEVVVLTKDEMPSDSGAAAIFRY